MAPKQEPLKKNSVSTEEPIDEDLNQGFGKFYYPTGATYEGEWVVSPEQQAPATPAALGEKPPHGGPISMELADSPRPNRRRHGRGLYRDGANEYIGDWKNDRMHGEGCFKYANGASYDGHWEENIYVGVGLYKVHRDDPPVLWDWSRIPGTYWPNGATYFGQWRDNKMHGDGTYVDKEGNSWAGQFFNGTGPGLICEIK